MRYFQIEIDLLETTEQRYREILETESEPYPMPGDFEISTPLEMLERYPIFPVLFTLMKIERQLDVTPFLKLQKPISNLPEIEQKNLILYLKDLLSSPVMMLMGKNVFLRRKALKDWKDHWINETLTAIIEAVNLSFPMDTLDTCPRCGDISCGEFQICLYCNYPIFGCEYKNATYHHAMQMTCASCGETHAGCLEHDHAPNQNSCAIRRRKSDTPALPSFDTADSLTAEIRRLLQYLKRDCKEILDEIRGSIPILASFHTTASNFFFKQYPIVPAILTITKEWKLEGNMISTSFKRSVSQLTSEDQRHFISALRDDTAKDWGTIWADRSVATLIEQMSLPLSLENIDLCERCRDVECTGAVEICLGRGGKPNGCGQLIYACDPSHRFLSCENPKCLRVNEVYLQCVGHTCIFS